MKLTTAATALEALAQQTRLEIFRLLVEAGREGMAAGSIATRLGVAAPTLSFHLAQLRHAGLVSCERHSRSLIYAADFKTMNALLAFLTENCCGGDPASCLPGGRPAAQSRAKKR